MRSLADGLPADVLAELPREWFANERDYWVKHPEIMAQYGGQWVAFADGKVLISGLDSVDVLHRAAATQRHPYVARVGAEYEPCRMRRTTFAYDSSYRGPPMPQVEAEFRVAQSKPGCRLDKVIPDTGADATALPWSDCRALGLVATQGVPAMIGGVAGTMAPTLMFPLWILLDGKVYPCKVQADFAGDERLLGRDVLNKLDILFRGPAREVIVNP